MIETNLLMFTALSSLIPNSVCILLPSCTLFLYILSQFIKWKTFLEGYTPSLIRAGEQTYGRLKY